MKTYSFFGVNKDGSSSGASVLTLPNLYSAPVRRCRICEEPLRAKDSHGTHGATMAGCIAYLKERLRALGR